MDTKDKTARPPVMLYTEQTPNPESLKFVTNQMLYPRKMADFRDEQKALAQEWSPLAAALFNNHDYVKGVYICNNFVTITKEFNYEWADVMMDMKEYLKKYIQDGGVIMKEGFEEVKKQMEAEREEEASYEGEDAEIVEKIKQILTKYVQPGVEMDGGNIAFRSFEKGIVKLEMQGACSGCPSSSQTLKGAIEGMLKRMIPQVKEVVAVMG